MATRSTTQPRKPKGSPVSGQWTTMELDHAQVSLVETRRKYSPLLTNPQTKELLAARRAQLEQAGFAPALLTKAVAAPTTTAKIESWWDTQMMSAEYTTGTTGYPQMPDNYTPKRTGGRSITGERRTHRMRYRTGGIDLRMPSRTAINRFMDETGSDTIEVPVAAGAEGQQALQGWVRITRQGPGRFTAEGLGMKGRTEVMVAEAVSATMEGRSAQSKLNSYDDMVTRRQQRLEAAGVAPAQVNSSWVDSVAYDDATGTMFSSTAEGRSYGHKVPKAVYENMVAASSPGRVFNNQVKGQERVDGVSRCGKCGHFTAAAVTHQCLKEATPSDKTYTNQRAATYVGLANPLAQADPASHVVDPNEQRIDLAAKWREEASGDMAIRGRHIYGERGFSTKAAEILAPNASSTYVPSMWGKDFLGESRANDGDLVRLDGVRGEQARQLLSVLPETNLDERQNDGPTVDALLKAAGRNPGKVELHGYAVSPTRRDERITFEGLNVYDNDLVSRVSAVQAPKWKRDMTPAETAAYRASYERYEQHVKSTYAAVGKQYGLDARQAPDSMQVVDNPWRPGQKAVHMWWD